MNTVNLHDIAGGALNQKFEHSFKRVVENLQDVNTPYKDKRQIVITITFEQNEQRDDVLAEIAVKEKLAPQGKLLTRFGVGKDLRTGKVYAEEHGNQLKGQMSINTVELDAEGENQEDDTVIDTQTGEIIDFRKAKGE
ncbi:MAG: hypothetical protein HFE90_08180 [Firmicutes bacterium]|nr:hypothetical protein [Bacillota bacterium]